MSLTVTRVRPALTCVHGAGNRMVGSAFVEVHLLVRIFQEGDILLCVVQHIAPCYSAFQRSDVPVLSDYTRQRGTLDFL